MSNRVRRPSHSDRPKYGPCSRAQLRRRASRPLIATSVRRNKMNGTEIVLHALMPSSAIGGRKRGACYAGSGERSRPTGSIVSDGL